MLQLIIFDYDGLMVDSEELAYLADHELLSSLGVHLDREYFNRFLGIPVIDTLKDYVGKYSLDVEIDALLLRREELMLRLEKNLKPMKGLFELLHYLHSSGIRMAIASSGKKNYVLRGLHQFGIKDAFEAVVCSDEVERGKPFPDLVLEALQQTGTDPGHACMLEDSLHGAEAARRAGVFCIVVPPAAADVHGYKQCDFIAADLPQVQRAFQFFLSGSHHG